MERKEYSIKTIALDGRPGVRQLFADIPVQMCRFHQKQIITRYLTNNPKLEAGIALKKLTVTLCETHESYFTSALDTPLAYTMVFLSEGKNNRPWNGEVALHP